MAQMLATLWSSIVQISVFNWALSHIPVGPSFPCSLIYDSLEGLVNGHADTCLPNRTFVRTTKQTNLRAQVPRSFTLLPSSGEPLARKFIITCFAICLANV
jgi:hypothetical protein